VEAATPDNNAIRSAPQIGAAQGQEDCGVMRRGLK